MKQKYKISVKWGADFFEKIHRIDIPLAQLRIMKENIHINKIRNEKENVTIDTIEIKRIIRKYYKELYANKLGNHEEMYRYLYTYNLRKLRIKTENLTDQ